MPGETQVVWNAVTGVLALQADHVLFSADNVHSEWRRLVKDAYHRMEFTTTLHFLEKYLPPDGHVLDAGGGPGRYTLELAMRGYDVTLLDATVANLDFARRHRLQTRVKKFLPGTIADLSVFPHDSFDAVLCSSGLLSHILDPLHRTLAISELVRVARHGAPIFVSVMGQFSVLVVILMIAQHEL